MLKFHECSLDIKKNVLHLFFLTSLVPQGIYALPNWVRERPNLSWDFSSENRLDFKQVIINYLPLLQSYLGACMYL